MKRAVESAITSTSEAAGEAAEASKRKFSESVSNVRDRRRRTRKRLEEIFSRDVLGSVLVSLAAGKVVEQVVVIIAPGRPVRLIAWFVAFWLFVGLFVYWHRVAEKAREVAEAAAEAEE